MYGQSSYGMCGMYTRVRHVCMVRMVGLVGFNMFGTVIMVVRARGVGG